MEFYGWGFGKEIPCPLGISSILSNLAPYKQSLLWMVDCLNVYSKLFGSGRSCSCLVSVTDIGSKKP